MPCDKAAVKSALAGVVDFSADFHALNSNAVSALADAAKRNGYRKPKNANGSAARYFFAYLNRGGEIMMNAQVHRFGDFVAVHIGDGQTVYLKPDEARAIAGALNKCAADVDACKFTKSDFSSLVFEFEGVARK